MCLIPRRNRKHISCIMTKYGRLNVIKFSEYNTDWASCVKDLLCRLGFLIVWETQGVGNVKAFLNICKLKFKFYISSNLHKMQQY